MLRDAGYRTALIGKWHLGYPPVFGPLKSGYDEFFGPMSRRRRLLHPLRQHRHARPLRGRDRAPRDRLPDRPDQRARGGLCRPHGRQPAPFFLSLHYTAPHWPWETRDDAALAEEVRGNLFHLHGGNIHSYRRMIHHMDEGIGRVMAALRRHGIERDTLVVFTSDNGGERFSDNWPLVGGKMDLTEGGIRVPWIAHWPAVIAPGGVSEQACLTMDWSATMLELGGASIDPDCAAGWCLDGGRCCATRPPPSTARCSGA
jgi:arylsulfatase A-like enzyme